MKMVESNSLVIRHIKENIALLNAKNIIQVEQRPAHSFLETDEETYDIVFADPPFDLTLLAKTCQAIASSKVTHDQTLLYLESARSREPLPIPSSWHIIRQKTRGRVLSTLIQTKKK